MKLRYRITIGLIAVLAVAVIGLAVVISYDTACTPLPAVTPGTETMQGASYTCYGGPEVLTIEELAKPVPAPGEVLVRVENAAVNPLDWHYLRGSPYIMRLASGIGGPARPRLGVDFAGTVESVGPGVTRFQPGDRVFGGKFGAFAEYVTVDAAGSLVPMPPNLDFEQAAGVPIAALTALQALRDHGGVQPGQKVLINGASGGVGTFAVQIARSIGAEVTGVCSTRNVELVRSLGADQVIDYKQADYTRGAQRWDVIIDNVGNHSVLANLAVLSDRGVYVIVGGPGGDWLGPLLRPLWAMLVDPFVDRQLDMVMARQSRVDLETLAAMLASGQLRTAIDRRFVLDDIAEAIRYSETGRARGKIIVEVAD